MQEKIPVDENNCHTTADGGCIGGLGSGHPPCIHDDPEAQRCFKEFGYVPQTLHMKPPVPCTGGKCDACNKIIEEVETAIRGYATGKELGLCRKCASFVNTPQAVAFADAKGFVIHSAPVYSPAKASYDGGTGYEEGELS